MNARTPERALTESAVPYGYTWTFVALEYYALILNRIYLVFVGDRMISGAYMGGPVAANPFPEAAWNPEYWISERRLARYGGMNVSGPEFRSRHWMNFQLARADIARVRFDRTPKWGMGNVPHSGRLHVEWRDGTRREFILLGRQDGPSLRDRLLPLGASMSVGSEDVVPSPVFEPPTPGRLAPEM